MYWAENECGVRVYIDESNDKERYCCPLCKGTLIRKLGSVTAHHFAHRPQADCDPWYTNHPGKGSWHKSMQEMFPKECQEVKVYADENPSICHFADVFIERPGKNNIVIEFQHSAISRDVFLERTLFYRSNNCSTIEGKKIYNSVIWVFDCKWKKMFIDDSYGTPEYVHVEWTGRDRIRFLREYRPNYKDVFIVFHATKNKFIEEPYTRNKVLCFDPERKHILINVMDQEDEYRYFYGEEILEEHFAEYITNNL